MISSSWAAYVPVEMVAMANAMLLSLRNELVFIGLPLIAIEAVFPHL
jgi:hypothetical protein